ncbi:MAG: hypothetical protein ACI4RN_02280 [Oscillospiraceae bacterium]
MADLKEYKCPACGGTLEFNTKVQKMKCPYCDSEFDMDTLKSLDEDLNKVNTQDDVNWKEHEDKEWDSSDQENLNTYVCKSCGGEIICDSTTSASSCPYCGNAVVMSNNLSGNMKPDYVIPFKLDKKAAKDALNKYVRSKKLVPKVFKDQNHIDEIKGLYVPFWLFDASVNADINYTATRISKWSDRTYDYTRTDFYSISRGGTIAFDNVPVDGSSTMPDDLMESVEPFNFSEAVDFQTAYLAGYLADKYDVDAEQSIVRANERIKYSTEENFKNTVTGYATVTTNNSYINLLNGDSKYALYPVWILNTSWNGKNYLFAMNGQTGKMVGDLPLDKAAYWRLFGILAASLSVLTYIILTLLNIL